MALGNLEGGSSKMMPSKDQRGSHSSSLAQWTETAGPTTMRSQLPEDVVRDILSRLPVKTLIRFRCVCKTWYSLLTSCAFVAMHLQKTRRRFYLLGLSENLGSPIPYNFHSPLPIPLLPLGKKHNCSLRHTIALVQEHKLDQPFHVEPPCPELCRDLDIIGSVNGLFCLAFNRGTSLVLWNPATRQSYQLPIPEILMNSFHSYSIGLGHDFGSHNGYKVVRVVFEASTGLFPGFVKAETWDLRRNSWSAIADPPQWSWGISMPSCGAIVKGVAYWPRLALSHIEFIISFDVRLDTFRTFRRPDFGVGNGFVGWGLGAIGDSLVTMASNENMGIDVWMIDQSGHNNDSLWIKAFSVIPMPLMMFWIGCLENGELLCGTADGTMAGKGLVLYNYRTRRIKRLPNIGSGQHAPDDVFVYTESLVSPYCPC